MHISHGQTNYESVLLGMLTVASIPCTGNVFRISHCGQLFTNSPMSVSRVNIHKLGRSIGKWQFLFSATSVSRTYQRFKFQRRVVVCSVLLFVGCNSPQPWHAPFIV